MKEIKFCPARYENFDPNGIGILIGSITADRLKIFLS
jgi:hypothetical protein